MTTTPLTPAALAEIRARDARDGAEPASHLPKHQLCFGDRRALLAEVSRLTAELAAARKPQGLKFPRATGNDAKGGWTIDLSYVRALKGPAVALGAPYGMSMEQIEQVLLALESLGAQDGGEVQS